MRTDVKCREIWEWSNYTQLDGDPQAEVSTPFEEKEGRGERSVGSNGTDSTPALPDRDGDGGV
jgi:hypothetical protein